jgi:dolichyl-diphosphooligosaccharide--protein glycosyltransferase
VTDGGAVRDRLPSLRHRHLPPAALAILVAARLFSLPAVIYPDGVVLLSNDPYFYRTLVDRTVAGPFSLPPGARVGEPLFVATLAAATALVGSSGVALAVYPVVVTALAGLLVHATATRVTDDFRVGVASVLWLAAVPAHAWRTSLGGGDHHAFDYLWVALTLYCLVALLGETERARRRTVGLGVGVGAQVLAWEAGPLLVLPAALGVGAVPFVRGTTAETARRLRPVVAGFGLAAVGAVGAHALLGWQSPPVVAVPGLCALGAVGVIGLIRVAARTPWPRAAYAVGGGVGLGVTAAALWVGAPAFRAEAAAGAGFLAGPGTWEMAGLFEDFGPVLGPVILLGYAPFVALAALPTVARRLRDGDTGWLFVGAYALVFGALAVAHRRFAGEFAAPLAVLAGMGLVVLLWSLGACRSALAAGRPDGTERVSLPGRRRVLLLTGVSVGAYAPGVHFTRLVVEDGVVDPRLYRAARWIEGYARRRGLEYPANYVLSEEGRNRMFNYFVSGDGLSAEFASETYVPLLTTGDLPSWYERLAGRVGFVVVRTVRAYDAAGEGLVTGSPPNYRRLYRHLGSASGDFDGVAHYRAVYTSPDRFVAVFELVPGATITGRGTPGERVAVETRVSLPSGTLDFRRETTAADDGTFAVTVPHPGRYAVGERSVRVSEEGVWTGATVPVE